MFRPRLAIQVRNSATGRPVAKSLAVAPVDVDNDGWIDFGCRQLTLCKLPVSQ
jgi:hypothetical protein